jgi:aminopeptidase N
MPSKGRGERGQGREGETTADLFINRRAFVVGAATFQRIERAWVQRYEGRSASTDDFIALASQVSHHNLKKFLRDWLYGMKTPPMPGHPDWTVDPVVKAQSRAFSAAAFVARGRG